MNADAFIESLRLLCKRRFGTFWFASLLSNIGTWAQQVAQPWLMLSLNASPFLLGLDSFALNSTQFNLSRILGPVVAGLLMAGVGAAGAFAVSAASYLPFILAAVWILPRGVMARGTDDGFVWHRLYANVREVLRQPVQRGALLTVFISGLLCAPMLVFCLALVKEVFLGDISHFSLAMAAFGVGGLLGAIGLLGVGQARDRRTLSSAFAITLGVVLVLSAWNRSTWGLPLLFVVAGAAMTLSNASANSMLQVSASPRLRGQTVSLFMLAMRGGMALGGLLTGLSVAALGIREALYINGVLAVLLQLVVARHWSRATPPVELA